MRLGPPVFHPGSLPQSNCPLPPKERSDAELSETAPDLTALGLCRNRRGYRHNRATNRNSLRGIRAQSQRERKSASTQNLFSSTVKSRWHSSPPLCPTQDFVSALRDPAQLAPKFGIRPKTR